MSNMTNDDRILKEGMFFNHEILITKKPCQETIKVFSEKASVMIITEKTLIDFFGVNYKNVILFNCFYSSVLKNKHIHKVFTNFIKVDKDIQKKINDFYIDQEETISKTKKKTNVRPKTSKVLDIVSFDNKNPTTKKNSNIIDLNSLFEKRKENRDINKLCSSTSQVNSIQLQSDITAHYFDPENKNIEMKELFKLFEIKKYRQGDDIQIKKDSCIIIIDGTIEEVWIF